MIVVLDVNVLLRFIDTTAIQHPVAVTALVALRTQGWTLRTVPQAIYEFWVVATRPVANNGLGLSPIECDQTVCDLVDTFPVLNDDPMLFTEWRVVVTANACQGKPAHDARYVAAMRTHGVTRILTFNVADFTRYPGLTVLDPNMVATSAPIL
ncbi:type II toxin-antitoxin system VapC family toxin [Fimbriiglobus ruber]|uniref:Toxin 1, PIN domain n=1 Tax=Fimbriiglobus ruber TaxID=1908690 RepID=A0A225E1K5_9BACT|nr:PIN domain nuclease [Fimbriiglobus ruber]OWK43906.1 Toxin 1, PIN domain [Fimbriiglobus ruber]